MALTSHSADSGVFNQTRERNIEVEEEPGPEDSAIGSDAGTVNTALSESHYNYRREHGRTYHAYKDGQYFLPNDDREADRLDLQHHMFLRTYDGALHLAPISKPRHALDIGTGTGIWAIDFAETYPTCEVIGTDLSPCQPSFVPPNLRFFIEDAEDEWVYPGLQFDYIHLRVMCGCFRDPRRVMRQAWEHLEPGGYIEFQDWGIPLKAVDQSLEGTHLQAWGHLLCEASARLGRPMGSDLCSDYKIWLHELGFVDIEERQFMWPSNGWPKDPVMKSIGQWNLVNLCDGLEGFCLALLSRGLGWQKQEIDVFVANVANDLRDRRIHAYFPMPVVWARKPLLASAPRTRNATPVPDSNGYTLPNGAPPPTLPGPASVSDLDMMDETVPMNGDSAQQFF